RPLRHGVVEEEHLVRPPLARFLLPQRPGHLLGVARCTHDQESHCPEPMNSLLVTCSSRAPRPLKTASTVRPRIERSSRMLRWSTYQTSSARRSFHDSALRPLTCTRPVTPGRTVCRRACSAE